MTDASAISRHLLDPPETDEVVHLTVGDLLEVRLDGHWAVGLRPRGLRLVDETDAAGRRTFVFRAEHGVGGLVRLERGPETLDVCVTVSS